MGKSRWLTFRAKALRPKEIEHGEAPSVDTFSVFGRYANIIYFDLTYNETFLHEKFQEFVAPITLNVVLQ